MKSLFALILGMYFLFTQDAGVIFWQPSVKLTWVDFTSTPDASSPYKAFTESEIRTEVSGKNSEAHISIKTFFIKNKSWVKNKTEKLLAHEQLHFDITELWARKFRQKIQEKTFSIKTFQKELNTIQNNIYKESKDMQVLYDKDTQHSEVVAEQDKWENKIKTEIENLKAFAVSDVNCTLSK